MSMHARWSVNLDCFLILLLFFRDFLNSRPVAILVQLKVFDVFDREVEKQFLPEPPALLRNTAEGYHKQWTINRRPKAFDVT